MKIAFLIRSLDLGGAQRQMLLLADGLAALGDSVRIFTFYPGGSLAPVVGNHSGVELISLGKRSRWDLVRPVVRFYQALVADAPDVLYTFMPVENLFGAAMRPFLRHTRLVWGIRIVDMEAGRLEPFLYWFQRLFSSVPDLIVANSKAGRIGALSSGMPANKVVVQPNGFDTVRFRPDAEVRSRVRAELGFTEHDFVIGHVARLAPLKDQMMLLRATSLLLKRRPNIRLLVVGEEAGPLAPYSSRLHEEAETLSISGRVTWLGDRRDVETLYNAFDVFALTSRSESFPNVLGEAMASGVPCVATDVGDCAWIIGDTGFVTPLGDPESFARALESAILSDRAELGARARQRIVSAFGMRARIVEVRDLLEALSRDKNSS